MGGGADSLGQCVAKELTDRKQPTWRQVLLGRKGWSTNTHLEAGVAKKEGLVNKQTPGGRCCQEGRAGQQRQTPTWRQMSLFRKGWLIDKGDKSPPEAGVAVLEGLVNRETKTHLEAGVAG